MLKTQLKFLITIVLVLGFSISLQSLLATWQGPTAGPPSLNIDRPINTGLTAQTKHGALDVLGKLGLTGILDTTKDININNGLVDSPQLILHSTAGRYSYIDNNNGDLRFVNNASGDLVRMIVKEDGRVGIGTINPDPASTLDVVGGVNASGNMKVGGGISGT